MTTSRLVLRLRNDSHYYRLRSVIQLATWVYMASAVLGLVVMLMSARHLTGAMMLMGVGGTLVHVVGALVVREGLQMVVDWFDGAMDQRSSTMTAREPGGGSDA